MEKVRRIYLAGPYTLPDPIPNVREAIVTAERLLEMGYVPFVPHLSHFWDAIFHKSWERWVEYDKEWIPVCDAVLRFPGMSRGADIEVEFAKDRGIPIFFSIEELESFNVRI